MLQRRREGGTSPNRTAVSFSSFVCARAAGPARARRSAGFERAVVRYSVHGGAWLPQMTEGYGALPGWGDGTGKPTRASLPAPAPAPVKKATVAPVTDEWTVVAGRGSRPRPAPLLANKHAPPASASNPAAATTSSLAASAKLSRALEDVGKDSLVSAVVSALRLPVRRALLLGLGPPVSSVTARHQLALALLLVATLKLDAALAVYDPVLGAEDVELLLRHGCRVVTEAEARLLYVAHVSEPALLIMPHCEAGLYDAVLQANWSEAQLPSLAILGNSFRAYADGARANEPDRSKVVACVKTGHVSETLVVAGAHHPISAFNNLALLQFSWPSHSSEHTLEKG